MLEFFKVYSFNEILIFLIMFSFAIKGIIDFVEWIKRLYEQKFNKDHQALNKQADLEKYYLTAQQQHKESLEYHKTLDDRIDLIAKTMKEEIDKIDAKLLQLTESDMHAIKGWIVERHHHFMKKGWIDDFTMDTLEHRYTDYVAEEGNSYIAGLMAELRALPHFPEE